MSTSKKIVRLGDIIKLTNGALLRVTSSKTHMRCPVHCEFGPESQCVWRNIVLMHRLLPDNIRYMDLSYGTKKCFLRHGWYFECITNTEGGV